MGDIAKVSFGLSELSEISHYNGKKNISININKTKEGNAIALSREIRAMIVEFAKEYDGVEISAYTDTSIWINYISHFTKPTKTIYIISSKTFITYSKTI